MTNLKIKDICTIKVDKEGSNKNEAQLIEIEKSLNDNLEHLKGNLVAKLSIYEAREQKTRIYTVFSNNPGDGIPHYSLSSLVETGVLSHLELSSNELVIEGEDNYNWEDLDYYNGPQKNINSISIPINSKLFRSMQREVVFWNGKLPYYIYSPRYKSESNLPYSCGASLESEVIVIGNNSVSRIFGLKPMNDNLDTGWIFESLLKKEGLDPDKILPYWIPEGTPESCNFKFSDEMNKLEEILNTIPGKFYKHDITTIVQSNNYLNKD